MCYIDLAAFDAALNMWVEGIKPGTASKLASCKGALYQFYKVFRRACSFYIRAKVEQYLKLPGPVEVDETKIGPKHKKMFGKIPRNIYLVIG